MVVPPLLQVSHRPKSDSPTFLLYTFAMEKFGFSCQGILPLQEKKRKGSDIEMKRFGFQLSGGSYP